MPGPGGVWWCSGLGKPESEWAGAAQVKHSGLNDALRGLCFVTVHLESPGSAVGLGRIWVVSVHLEGAWALVCLGPGGRCEGV